MRQLIISLIIAVATVFNMSAQTQVILTGNCGTDCKWSFDGYTLKIYNANKKGLDVNIQDYNTSSQLAPWTKKKLDVRKVEIERGISSIG